jgi:hypothetical protein
MKNFATLREDSPFFDIFASGQVPILNVFNASEARLEGSDETEVYFVDWTALTIAQRALVGNKVVEMRGGTFRQFMKHMADGGRLPLRVSQTTSAQLGASTRFFT